MPKLNCFVELCKYQKEGFCSARSIDVANFTALTSDETTCATYVPIQVSSEKSSHHAIEEISINCDASYCLHNNNQLCNAKAVLIDGFDSAKTDGTECASFLIK